MLNATGNCARCSTRSRRRCSRSTRSSGGTLRERCCSTLGARRLRRWASARRLNVGLQGRFAEWAGEVLASDREVVLVGDPATAVEAKVRLARVGYDRVVGQLDDPAGAFSSRPDLIDKSSRLTIEQLAELRGLEPGLQLVDVRSPAETAGRHAARCT